MSATSIIEIDVQDQAFKDFQALFEKYQTQLDKLPGSWGKVDRAIKATNNPVKQVKIILDDVNAKLDKAKNSQEKFKIVAQGTGKVFGTMASDTGKLAKNLKDITVTLLRWTGLTGVFAGLLGAGGLMGLDKLGGAASNARRESQGLGITSGEHAAAKINYEKLVDVDAMLSKINDAKQDVTKRSAFAAAGMNPGDWEKQDAAQILTTLIPQLKEKWSQGDGTKQYADASGLTQFVDMETLNRLKSVTQAEIDAATASYEADKKKLNLSDTQMKKWQDFNIQLDRTKSSIEKAFIVGLSNLAGPMTKLSAAFSSAIEVFLSSPKVAEWVDSVSGALERFAKYLSSDEFSDDIKDFFDGLSNLVGSLITLAEAAASVVEFFNGITKTDNERDLKSGDRRKLKELKALNPTLGAEYEERLKNPTLTKQSDAVLGIKDGQSNALKDALKGPDSARIGELIKSLNDSVSADRVVQKVDTAAKSIPVKAVTPERKSAIEDVARRRNLDELTKLDPESAKRFEAPKVQAENVAAPKPKTPVSAADSARIGELIKSLNDSVSADRESTTMAEKLAKMAAPQTVDVGLTVPRTEAKSVPEKLAKIATPQTADVGPTAPRNEPTAAKVSNRLASAETASDIDKLKKLGWTDAQAAGIAANIQRESAGNDKAVGDQGQAYGLAQWHPDRQADFAKYAGHDIRKSNRDEQLAFIDHELRDGKEQDAGNKLRDTKDPASAAAILSKYYERPRDTSSEQSIRAGIANSIAGLVKEAPASTRAETVAQAPASSPQQPAGRTTPQTAPVSVTIFKTAGADVCTTVNGLGS